MSRDPLNVERQQRDPARPGAPRPQVFPRVLSVSWASITRTMLEPAELIFNAGDNSFVYRKGDNTLYRFDNIATRTI